MREGSGNLTLPPTTNHNEYEKLCEGGGRFEPAQRTVEQAHECVRLALMIPAMPTLTNVRLIRVSLSQRNAHSIRRCISTSKPPQPPAFVFDIVSTTPTTTVQVEVAEHSSERMAYCSEVKRSWNQRGTHSGSFTVRTRLTGGLAWISERVKMSSHRLTHRKIPYIFVRHDSGVPNHS